MSISHFKSVTIADGTDSNIVRPSDWNSAHNLYQTYAGNTAGASTFSGANLVWAGGNNITLSHNGSTVSVVGPSLAAFLTTGAASDHSHGNPTLALTNLTGTTASNSAGFTLSLSAALGGGAGDGGNVIAAGGSTAGSTGTILFQNSGGVSFGFTNGTQITATVRTDYQSAGAYLTTAANSTHSHNFATTTTNGAAIVVGTANSAGATIGVPAFLTTAQAPGAYLTTARASNDGIGLNSALTANGVSVTANSSGLSLNFPAFLTTAAQSGHSHGNPTLALTNITGTTASASNGFTLSLSAGGGGVTNQTGPNIAAGASTVTSGDVLFSNLNGVSFGLNGSTMTASYNSTQFAGTGTSATNASITMNSNGLAISVAAPGGGGAATVGGWELFPPLGGNTAFSTFGLGTIYFQKFICPQNISFNNIERRYSGSTVSSAVSAQAAHSYTYGIYSLGTGGSTSIYELIASSSILYRASYSSNLSAGYTVSQGAASFTASSAGTVGQGNLTGYKHIYLPFSSTLTAGGYYAVAMVMSSATTGATGPLRIGLQELSVINNLTIGKIKTDSVYASNASYVGDYAQGVYSSSSNGLPATLAISGLTNAVSQQRMYLQFEV